MNSQRREYIKAASIQKPYIFSFFGIFFLYNILNIFLNKLYITFPELLGTYLYASAFILLQLIIGFGIALAINLSIKRIKDLNLATPKKHKGLISSAIAISLIASGCPGCIAGLFPAFLGLFGVSASLGILPLYGLELQIISILLLAISIWYLTKPIVCKIKR